MTTQTDVESRLQRWLDAAVIDTATADRIRAFESERRDGGRLNWPVLLAIGLGSLMLAAGILLFVAAHWDALSPTQRFLLVLSKVALFHILGAIFSRRWPAAATAMHMLGTIACGAAIYLTAQIFNVQEHWPGGLMMWTLAAAIGWAILRDAVQPALFAILLPAWLAGEWSIATERRSGGDHEMFVWLLGLAIVYFTLQSGQDSTPIRRALKWIGGLALFPLLLAVSFSAETYLGDTRTPVPTLLLVVGWGIGLFAPLALAWFMRKDRAWITALATIWVVVFYFLPAPWHNEPNESLARFAVRALGPFLWEGLGSVLLIWWGLLEGRRERINVGVAMFAVAVGEFYFSEIMDKLGRSESLIAFGVLFLAGGWLLERTRRRLVARIPGGAA